jgi:periplasmic protein TonB
VKTWIVLAALAAANAAWAQPAPSPPPMRHPAVIVNPELVQKPTPEQFASVYPTEAMKAGLSGEAVIQCVVGVDGRLAGCKALSEDPPGQGFGDAAVKLAAFILMKPKTIDGTPVPDGFTTRVRFTLQGDSGGAHTP